MLQKYFRNLYGRTMRKSYDYAHHIIVAATGSGRCLDCGAGAGEKFDVLNEIQPLNKDQYTGVEWEQECVKEARADGLDVRQGDLNRPLAFGDAEFDCVFGISVLEHLVYPCRFLKECSRILKPGGTMVMLTPNISTYFTAALILSGKMPSSGPHPDSVALQSSEEFFRLKDNPFARDDSDTPRHRHLVVFSYRVLQRYLRMLGFSVTMRGFGIYPFPNFSQPLFERIDPIHCHQMVAVARK